MRRNIELTTGEKKAIVSFLIGKLSFGKTAKALDCSKQGVYVAMTLIFKDLVESKKIDIKEIIKKY